jgi:anaerobic selenocysteine-containing dehydrogenase
MMTHQGNLFRHIRSNNRFSATSVDQLPHHLAALWLFGHKTLFPVPDIDHSQYMLMLGANPIASNGSLWTVPDVKKRIKALQARGGKLVVIDPRRTETAEIASEHHFITPGTDALFLLALLNTLFSEGLVNPGHLGAFTTGLEEVGAAIADFTPEFAAQHTGLDATEITRIAREFAAAPSAICYGRMGVSTQAYGGLCQWLIQVINIATGNLDKPGGSLFASPAVDMLATTSPGGFDRHQSRVRGLPEFDRELPAAAMAEEITTPGEGQIKALFTGAGNPVLSTPNGRQLDQALEQLDFMVADIILPPTSPLEHDHYDISFHLLAVRNTSRHSEAIFDKPEGALHDWEIFSELGQRVATLLGQEPQPATPPHEIIDFGLQMGPYASQGMSLEKLRQNPSGVDLGPLQPQLPERLFTSGKQITCNTPQALADLARLKAEFTNQKQGQLRLIGRRHVRSNNSWMHNYRLLVKGRERCSLMMHPQDMDERGLVDGGQVTLSSRAGALEVKVEASDNMMPGVVSLPHGYGHGRDNTRMGIANEHAGVSCNDVTDELYLDALSGNAAVNGVLVSVESAN